jgi:hypothetical protein
MRYNTAMAFHLFSTGVETMTRKVILLGIVGLVVLAGMGMRAAQDHPAKQFVAVAWVELRATKPVLMSHETESFNLAEFELFKRTQAATIDRLLSMVVPELSLPLLKDVGNPIAVVRSRLEVTFPHDGQLMKIFVKGSQNEMDQWAQVVTAVTNAYVDGSKREQDLQARSALDLLRMERDVRNKHMDDISQHATNVIRKDTEDTPGETSENATGKNTSDSSSYRAFLKREFDGEAQMYDMIGKRIALLRVNLAAPSRVHIVMPTKIEAVE